MSDSVVTANLMALDPNAANDSSSSAAAAAAAAALTARVAAASPEAKRRAAVMMWEGLWRFPLVYLIVFGLRFALLTAFRPLFRLEGSDLPVRDALFATVAGLRGSVALILAQAVITAGDSEAVRRSFFVLFRSQWYINHP